MADSSLLVPCLKKITFQSSREQFFIFSPTNTSWKKSQVFSLLFRMCSSHWQTKLSAPSSRKFNFCKLAQRLDVKSFERQKFTASTLNIGSTKTLKVKMILNYLK